MIVLQLFLDVVIICTHCHCFCKILGVMLVRERAAKRLLQSQAQLGAQLFFFFSEEATFSPEIIEIHWRGKHR